MNQRLDITKEYLIKKSFEDTVFQLQSIVTAKYGDSTYSTFGKQVSIDPPEYILMTKGYSIGSPLFPAINSTKIKVNIFSEGSQSKILVKTQTNPVFFLILFVFVLLAIIAVFATGESNSVATPALFLLLAIGAVLLDKFKKNDLINRFERDLKVKEKK